MDYSKIQVASRLAGFSKRLGAPSNEFIQLDKDTGGSNGRAIFIHEKLVDKFAGFKNVTDLLYAFHRIKQLQSMAGLGTSYSNTQDETEKMLVIRRAKVIYKVFTGTGDPKSKPGVYITNLDLAGFSDDEPGIYKVVKDKNDWNVKKDVQSSITSNYAAINGLCESMQQAGSEIMPPMLESIYGEQNAYDLFYNPPTLYDGGKEWKSAKQRLRGDVATELLKTALKSSVNKEVNWVVHGDGAILLNRTLQKIGTGDFSKHSLIFMAPMETVANILPVANRLKMKIHDDVMKIHEDDLESQRHQWGRGNRKKLEKEMKTMGMGRKGYELANKLRRDRWGAAKVGMKAYGAGFSVGALLAAPAIPALTLGGAVGGAVGAAFTAAGASDTAQSIRNRMSNKITSNTALNPHLNPHKTADQLNYDARESCGSLKKTFMEVVKARLKG